MARREPEVTTKHTNDTKIRQDGVFRYAAYSQRLVGRSVFVKDLGAVVHDADVHFASWQPEGRERFVGVVFHLVNGNGVRTHFLLIEGLSEVGRARRRMKVGLDRMWR